MNVYGNAVSECPACHEQALPAPRSKSVTAVRCQACGAVVVVDGKVQVPKRSGPESVPDLFVGLYRHYKGDYYLLLGVGQHTETGERMAVYVSLDAARPGPRLRIRPLTGPEGFLTPVGPEQPRFVYVGVEQRIDESAVAAAK